MLKLFEPGFTTAKEKTSDAGHGVGLDVVQTKVRAIGGELKTNTRADEFTQFTIHLSQPALAASAQSPTDSSFNKPAFAEPAMA